MNTSSKLKIAIIGTVGIPSRYGGFETLAENLVAQLEGNDEFTVYCSAPSYKNDRKKTYLGAVLKYLPFQANGKSSIIYDVVSILHAMFFADVLLILGVSGAFMIRFVRWFTNKKVITNIDGLEWKRDKWGGLAKKYLKKQEKIALRFSHHTIVDNKGIENYVLEEYGLPSTLIAYGADHVFYRKLSESTKDELQLPERFAFKVCRIEPENNIHIILKAFGNTELNLVVVGNWNNSDYGKELKKEYSVFKNLYLLDPIYDPTKLNELRGNCFLYLHGHSAGGTNPSLVEAMYLGLPIVAFDVNYNRHTTKDEALYFKTDVDLLRLLDSEIRDADRLNRVASQMKIIAEANYTWKIISNSYESLFRN